MKTKLVTIAIIAILSCLTYSYSQDQNIEQLSVIYNNRVEKLCDTLDGFKGPDHQLLRGFQWGNSYHYINVGATQEGISTSSHL